MISKELLSEICQTNLVSLGKLEVIGSDICLYDCSMQPDICMCWNIYELAHKCKEWSYKQGYSYLGNDGLINIHSKDKRIISLTDNNILYWFDINIDFKACEWILKEISK